MSICPTVGTGWSGVSQPQDPKVKQLLEVAAVREADGKLKGHSPNRWTDEQYCEALSCLKSGAVTSDEKLLEGLCNGYCRWPDRLTIAKIRDDVLMYGWASKHKETAKDLVKHTPPPEKYQYDKTLWEWLQAEVQRQFLPAPAPEPVVKAATVAPETPPKPATPVAPQSAPTVVPETPPKPVTPVVAKTLSPEEQLLRDIGSFCSSIGNAVTDQQRQWALSFIGRYEKLGSPKELGAAIETLRAMIPPEKGATEYVDEIKGIFESLKCVKDEKNYLDATKLKNPCQAAVLLKELQGKEFDDQNYKSHRQSLGAVINVYVQKTFTDSRNENQVKKAIELLSSSRSQNPGYLLPFQAVLEEFVNNYASGLSRRFPRNPQELTVAPVGIVNGTKQDAACCFMSSWMQCVANNPLLSRVYQRGLAERASLQNFLRDYAEAQRSSETPPKPVQGIHGLRDVLRVRGQQDANDFANTLHNEIPFDHRGLVGSEETRQTNAIKFGARVMVDKNGKRSPFTTSRDKNPYTFPSRQLGFDPDDLSPSLERMIQQPEVGEAAGGRVVVTTYPFVEVPEVFIYQFTRNAGMNEVNRTEVDMPLYHTIDALDETRGVLQLQSFVRHLGGPNGGHYVSYMAQGGKYWLANDHRMSEITAADYLVAARHATTAVYSTVQKTRPERKE